MTSHLLASKHRRLKEWLKRAKESPTQSLHIKFLDKLNQYRDLLTELWLDKEKWTSEKSNNLISLERDLESLDNSARVLGVNTNEVEN